MRELARLGWLRSESRSEGGGGAAAAGWGAGLSAGSGSGRLGRGGLGFRGGNGIAWLLSRGLVPSVYGANRVGRCLASTGGAAGCVLEGERRRSGIRPSMAAIIARAFIWPAMLPLVASWLRVASSQRRFRIWSRPKFSLRSPSGFLVHQPFPDGGAVLQHVGADAGFGFGVGGGFGIETNGFCGAAVSHGSGHDQVSKGHFLIGDGIGNSVFGHRSSHSLVGGVCRGYVVVLSW